LEKNPKLYKEFTCYKPKPIHLISNLYFSIADPMTFNDFEAICKNQFSGIANGFEHDKIIEVLEKNELMQYFNKPQLNATLQFECKDHEVINTEFIFREFRILNY
jgi:hypothetical protein